MGQTQPRRIASWVISAVLMLVFLVAAATKLAGVELHKQHFAHWGYPDWFRIVTGVIELAAAVLVIVPRTRFWGATLLIAVMVGAIATHLRFGEYRMLFLPSALLALAALDAWLAKST